MLGKIKKAVFNAKLRLKYGHKNGIKIAKQKQNYECGEMTFDDGSNVTIKEGLMLKKNVSIRCRKGAELIIGKNAYFNNNCVVICRKRISIGDNVSFGPNVCIFDHDHDYKVKDRRQTFILGDIVIGDNVWVGASAIILKGANIGKNCVIAAGAVVNGDVPDNTVYYGKNKMKPIIANNE